MTGSTVPHRHAHTKRRNTQILREAGIPFSESNNGETLLIRQPFCVADYYPSTNRWRDVATNAIYDRGNDFVAWYKAKQADHDKMQAPLPVVKQGRKRKYFMRPSR